MFQHGAADGRQMFYPAHQSNSAEGFREKLHGHSHSLFLLLSPWDCIKRRGQHCFFFPPQSSKFLTGTSDEVFASNKRRARCFSNIPVEWNTVRRTRVRPKAKVLTEPLTSVSGSRPQHGLLILSVTFIKAWQSEVASSPPLRECHLAAVAA